MLRNIRENQGCGEKIGSINRRMLAVVILVLICSFNGFGQTDYSDSWLDDSNPDAVRLVAVGITDDDYTADAIAVETTFTSPNGRSTTGYADGYGSARVEIELPWDWDDLGDYVIRTTHQPLCWGNWDGSMIYEVRSGGQYYWHWNPDYYRCLESRETTAIPRAGISFSVYENTFCFNDGTCEYEIIQNCGTACKWQKITTGGPCQPYLIRKTPFVQVFGRIVCTYRGAKDERSWNAGLCYDLDTQ